MGLGSQRGDDLRHRAGRLTRAVADIERCNRPQLDTAIPMLYLMMGLTEHHTVLDTPRHY